MLWNQLQNTKRKPFLSFYEKYDNNRNFTEIKKHAMGFTKGVSKNTRYKITKAKSIREIKSIYEDDLI